MNRVLLGLKFTVIGLISLLFFSCNNNYDQWLITNTTEKNVDLYFNDTSINVPAKTKMYYSFPYNTDIKIDKALLVEYTRTFLYENCKTINYLILKNVPEYNYVIYNSSDKNIVIKYFDDYYNISKEIQLFNNTEISLTIYKTKPEFLFLLDNYEINYTESFNNGTYFIYIN